MPAFPNEFILVDILNNEYSSTSGIELIENSYNLLPFKEGVNVDLTGYATEDFVNQAITTAISNIPDNRLEFPTYADFPTTGDETKFYIDLEEDKIYIWDSTSSAYKVQSWDTYTISQINTSLSSAAMAIYNLDQSKLNNPSSDGTYLVKKVGGTISYEAFSGGGNSTQLIEVTKAELDTHISNSTLIPNTLYKITGVQPFLYGGTDIYLKAISINALEEKGMGKFYVPKYDKNIDRYGIFDGYVNVSVTNSSYPDGSIPYGASVTTNNGATGKFRSVNLIEYVSGDWGTVTEMYINGITFNVTSATTSIYSVNDTAIFGGKVWKNITGNHGNIVDIFTLSNDWEVIAYNEADYNIEFDEIGYDVENDCITYRRDKSNNIVEFSYNWWFFLENDYMYGDMENSFCNPIKSFQWGNHFDYSAYKGVMGNSIYNSIFECINSTLECIYSNTLNNGQIYSNTLENNGQIYSNTLNNGYIYSNTLNSGQISSNTLNSGQVSFNNLNNGQIYSNTLNNGYISSNTLNGGNIFSNTLNSGQINSNTLNNGYIYSNTLNNGQIYSNTLENNGQINFNTLENNGQIRLGLLNPINNKIIQYLTINSSDIGGSTGIDLSTATLVYANYERIVFKNSAEVTMIRYIDGSGNTVIANLTD